ncbi:hypothetical protein M8C21_011024, partial [Ambrosia artemisiifolia]
YLYPVDYYLNPPNHPPVEAGGHVVPVQPDNNLPQPLRQDHLVVNNHLEQAREADAEDMLSPFKILHPEVNNYQEQYSQTQRLGEEVNDNDDFNWNMAYDLIYPEENNETVQRVVIEECYEQSDDDYTQPAHYTPEWAKGYESDPGAEYADWTYGAAARDMEWEWERHDPWDDECGTDS